MEDKEKLQDLMRQLMVLNTEYVELMAKLSKVGKFIFVLYRKIDEKLNGKDKQ